ncbi:hypothetical protein O0L34_g5077 [Tuta absoluta]|nr:hypothetical protein O0L34_g5077 [Tuta absoluta]
MAICLKCNKEISKIDDKNPKIKCHGCERHICVKCSGLLATELRVVVLQSPTLKYLCPECELGVRQLPALRNTVEQLKAEIEILKSKQNNTTSMECILSELAERKKRSVNVIMFGIGECSRQTGDAARDKEVRVEHDKTQVRQALAEIPDVASPVAVIRLGKPRQDSTPRPLKVIFSNKKAATNVLKNNKKLPASVLAKNDLTPYQQEYLKGLREELNKRTENGEADLTIKYINNTPKIISTKKS